MSNVPPPSLEGLLRLAERARSARRDPPPAHRIAPGPRQESVWDFPRPPRVEAVAERVRVIAADTTIADTTRCLRIVETAGAPCDYVPPADCRIDAFAKTNHWTLCEWKGIAFAYDIVAVGRRFREAAWSYPDPLTDLGQGYERIAGYFAFYAARVDACYVGDEKVVPQRGGFYGGWIRANLTGPIKGDPQSANW
jgi:uncharacterized protein (DUF427 family)